MSPANHDAPFVTFEGIEGSGKTTQLRRLSAHLAAAGVRPGARATTLGMGLSYVALLTAFYVDNGPHLPLWDRLPTITFWVAPALIGAPVILRALTRPRTRAEALAQPPRR